MPITVCRDYPPPYAVTTCQGPEETTQTLAFATLQEAQRAYRSACQSSQFDLTVVTGRGDMTLTLVSLWRREDGQTISGEPAVSYVEMEPRPG